MKIRISFPISLLGFMASLSLTPLASAQNLVLNPGFETPGATTSGAANWNVDQAVGGALHTAGVTNVDPHGSAFELDLESQGDGASGVSIQVSQTGIPVTAGSSNAFSFWAKKAVSLGGANPQWNIFWFDSGNAFVGQSGFTSFGSIGTSYTQITNAVVAPNNAAFAQVMFLLAGGAGTGDHWLVRIDDVSLTSSGSSSSSNAPITASIAPGTAINWTSTSGAQDQVQWSTSPAGPWTNLGAPIPGINGNASAFDLAKHSFYQIIETTGGGPVNGVLNPGFETADVTTTGAASWNLDQAAGGSLHTGGVTNVDPHTGQFELDMEAQGDGASGVSIQVSQVGIPVNPGDTNGFSFWAKKAVSLGGANPQWNIFWFDSGTAFVGQQGFTSFSSIGTSYTLITNSVVVPTNAAFAQVIFLLAGGAGVGDHWVVRVDDVTLSSGTAAAQTNTLAAVANPGVRISWPSVSGKNYQVQSSPSLLTTNTPWANLGSTISGNGATNSITDTSTTASTFYRIKQVP